MERVGNRLPDPALLFVIFLVAVWIASWLLSNVTFSDLDPRTGKPLQIQNLLTGAALTAFMAGMVNTFTEFPPLGVVLVALLGVGVAEHTGLVGAALRALLGVTPRRLLTPMVIFIGILSHVVADAGYVLVIPLAAVIFRAAGRHPLAGIAAGFAGVAGGFAAGLVPSALDPLLQGFTQSAAQIVDPNRAVNPLCNWAFCAASVPMVVGVGWLVSERLVEPRLQMIAVDGDGEGRVHPLSAAEKRGLWAAIATVLGGIALLVAAVWSPTSPLRSPSGHLASVDAPLMQAIIPLIFLLFLVPGVVYGYVARTISSHKDIVHGMSKAMGTMGYYLVLAFCAALFTRAFAASNLAALIAIKGAATVQALDLSGPATILLIIAIVGVLDLLIGSASAKWAMLAPILVPMMMQLGFAPELTQLAYRIGDSTANIITPLMPYFPLVVVYCQRHSKSAGMGTLVSMMLPYSIAFSACWGLLLLAYWAAGIPMGLGSAYSYP